MIARAVCFFVCLVIAPGLMVLTVYSAVTLNYWLMSATWGGVVLLHLLYPLSKVDAILDGREDGS